MWADRRSKFKALVHFLSCRICGKKDSLLSNITPRNLVSSTTGIDDPLRNKHGETMGVVFEVCKNECREF